MVRDRTYVDGMAIEMAIEMTVASTLDLHKAPTDRCYKTMRER